MALQQPDPFWLVRVHDIAAKPSVSGLCVGYESGSWRVQDFASHIMEWLPEFCLTHTEIEGIHSGNMISLIRSAAKKVYKSGKFENRGEFGEIFLHAAIRQVFGSLPAISKIFYKTTSNDTVKGFDAVHVVSAPDGLELWLGEAKFYSDIKRAIKDVVDELKIHTQIDYLRDEFLMITGKIDPQWPHSQALKKMISPNTSLDDVFKRACIPVLLTYNSPCIENHSECSLKYVEEFQNEVSEHYKTFCNQPLPMNVIIHLFLFPIHNKKELVSALDKKLKGLQNI